jgi:hypothetical protein
MADEGTDEARELLALWDQNVCAFCGMRIPGGKKLGSGRKADGGFCSLECYASYHGLDSIQRARRRAGLQD